VQTILPIALGFAAGCMIWMVFAELLPDALERTPAAQVMAACA
jgi:zinc transporter ZupT